MQERVRYSRFIRIAGPNALHWSGVSPLDEAEGEAEGGGVVSVEAPRVFLKQAAASCVCWSP